MRHALPVLTVAALLLLVSSGLSAQQPPVVAPPDNPSEPAFPASNGPETKAPDPPGTGSDAGKPAETETPSVQGPPSVSDNLPVHFASYLGGPGVDDVVAVEITSTGNVVVAGRLADIAYGGTRTDLIDGPASVFLLPPDGKPFLFHTRVGDRLADMAVSRESGNIALAGSLGVALLKADGSGFLWQDSLPIKASRIAIGHDDTVAALDGRRLSLYDKAGRRLDRLDLDDRAVTDVEIDSANRLVFVTGFRDMSTVDGLRVQSAFVEAYGYDLKKVWQAWGYGGSQLGDNRADTHGLRLTMGKDGKLYFLGEAAGGDSQFVKDAQNPHNEGVLTRTDRYNTPFRRQRVVIAFYARLEPASGRLLKSQYAIPRLGADKGFAGNTFFPRAIAADEVGNVLIGGLSGRGIPDREKQTIAGTRVGDYGGDPALLVVSSDFTRRLRWTTFAGGGIGNRTRIETLAVGKGLAAAGITLRGGKLVTVDPLRFEPDEHLSAEQTDGYVALWSAP